MALTLPTTTDLATFQNETSVEDGGAATFALQQAADLVWISTGLEEDPTDERMRRMVKNAICDMAWFLLIQTQDKEETYSGHSSERIGSYSYSKAQRQIALNEPTGVFWFDALRDALAAQASSTGGGTFSSTSEDVFTKGFSECEVPRSVRFDFYGW